MDLSFSGTAQPGQTKMPSLTERRTQLAVGSSNRLGPPPLKGPGPDLEKAICGKKKMLFSAHFLFLFKRPEMQ